jgi:hypothetical protein
MQAITASASDISDHSGVVSVLDSTAGYTSETVHGHARPPCVHLQ